MQKVKLSADQIERDRAIKIKNIKNEINNLRVILKALPDTADQAIGILADQIDALEKKLPKHEGRIWWHWLLEYCPKCACVVSQQPMSEDLGEDCALYQKVDEYNDAQNCGDTGFRCDCGEFTVMKSRPAWAGMSSDQLKEAQQYAESRYK